MLPPTLQISGGRVRVAISELYEGTGDPRFWDRVATNLASGVHPDAVFSLLAGQPDRPPFVHVISSNRGEQILQEYMNFYYADDPRVVRASRQPGSFVLGVPEDQDAVFDRTALACDYLNRPDVGARHSMSRYSRYGDAHIIFSFLRPRCLGRFSPLEVDEANRIASHLQQLAEFQVRLHDMSATVATLMSSLALVPQPVLLVDRKLRVSFMNPAAEAAIASIAGVAVVEGRLRAERSADQQALEAAASRASEMRQGGQLAPQPVVLRRGESDSVAVLRFATLPFNSALGRAEVMIMLSARNASATSLGVVLNALGCSRVEIQIALALAEGEAPSDIALARSVSLETVRTQIKSVMRKTGCSGQRSFLSFVRQVG